MKLKNLPEEFREAIPVMRRIKAAGYEAYFVGGSVRDVLLGKKIHDVDIATSAFPSEIKELFPRTIDVGIQHGTVMVLAENHQTYEITTFRTESTYQDFRRPDHVEFVRSLEEDLKRRDFTINAFALKEDGEIIDLFNGLDDLEHKVLRAVGNPHERFHEDALRMMRGLRFMSDLGFSFEPETFAAILENHGLLKKISVERLNVEFTKILLGKFRNGAIKTFVETKCYQYCPGLLGMEDALRSFSDIPDYQFLTEEQAWSLLAYMLQLDERQVGVFLKAWKGANKLIQQVRSLVKGLYFRLEKPWTSWMLYQLGEETVRKVEELMPYFYEENQEIEAIVRYQRLPIHEMKELNLSGTDLLEEISSKGGRWVSRTLKACEQEVVNGKLPNERQPLLGYAKTFYQKIQQED